MNTCAGPATPVEKQVVFVFVYQIDWLIMVDIPMIFSLTILIVTTSFLMIYIPIFQTCKNNYITPNLCGQYVQMLHPRSPKQRLTSFPAATETLDPASGFSVSSAFSSGSFSSTWHVWKGTTWENIGRFRGWRRRRRRTWTIIYMISTSHHFSGFKDFWIK